jgi:anti-sigma factor (TIGR02949 family)
MNHNHNLNCQDILRHVNDYLDEELEQELCAEIEAHIASCPNCKIVVNTLKKTIQLYHSSGQEIALPGDVLKRLVARLDEESHAKEE